jgi:CubicO group peptidase (beta-lactamase class C family)
MKLHVYILFVCLFSVNNFVGQNLSDSLDNYLTEAAKNNKFSGNVLIAKGDKILFQKSYGLADVEQSQPNALNTKFVIASITKQFTCVGILLLEQQGKLSTEDKLSKYYPDFPRGDEITLHMLMCNRSGIWSFAFDKGFYKKGALTESTVIEKAKKKELLYKPGTSYNYSNTNYLLLACIIEKVTNLSFEEFLKRNILLPLDMNSTGVYDRSQNVEGVCKSYEPKGAKLKCASYMNIELSKGAGNMYSSVGDLLKWNNSLMNGTILSKESKRRMLTAYTNGEEKEEFENYGYGIVIDTLYNHPRFGHDGWMEGYKANNMVFPNDSLCIIMLSNNLADPRIGNDLAGIIFGRPPKNKKS